MPRSSKKVEPGAFKPVQIEVRPPLEEEWEPSQLIGERVVDVDPAANDLSPELPSDPDAVLEDEGPGSAALAARFEMLPIEWVTGEPAVETLRFELSDGLQYVGELAEDDVDGDEGDSGDEPGTALDEAAPDLEGDEPMPVDPESDEDSFGEAEAHDLDEGAGEASDPVDASEDPVVEQLPANAVSEAVHRAALEAVRAEAFQQGLERGIEDGLRQGVERGREQGLSEGREEARQSYEADFSARQAELDALIAAIQASASDSHRLFTPLKRLALHLAEQLVRGELSLSGEAINRLVEHALVEVDRSPGNELVVSLNPEDLERWKRVAPPSFDTLDLRPDPGLSIGSVRVSAGESIIEDLIEHRLHQMASRLLGEVPARGFSRVTSLRMNAAVQEDISDVG